MLTPLQKAVIEALLEERGEPFDTIREQLLVTGVSHRRFSGVGFFTEFSIPADAPLRRDLLNMTLGDVGAEVPGLPHGAGFLLFVRDGVVTMLEGYSYGEPWPKNTDEFRVYRQKAA